MALSPVDEIHAMQIQAGTLGRKAGHLFEDHITGFINNLSYPLSFSTCLNKHVNKGDPAYILLHYIASTLNIKRIDRAVALSTGALATSEKGKKWLELNGIGFKRCKSDLIINLHLGSSVITLGVSTKQCNNKTPTNAQLYFTTARGFVRLLSSNGIAVSDAVVTALRQFCGDQGFRPYDSPELLNARKTDPRRYFWEEIDPAGRIELELTFSRYQKEITKLLLQKAYIEDIQPPDFLLHKTTAVTAWKETEVAIYSIEELTDHSLGYAPFLLKPYSVRKGSYKDPPGVSHFAPRFGIVQLQRGGQAQHPEQLQFNLEAGYFYKIGQYRPNMVSDSSSQ